MPYHAVQAQLASAGSPGLPQASAGSDGLMDMGMGSGGVADLLPADFGDTGMGLMGMDVDQPDLAEGGDPAGLLLQPGTQPEDAVGGGGSGGRRRSVRLHTGQLEGAAAPPPPTAPSSAAATGGRPFRPASLKGMQLSPSALPTTVAAGVLARGPKVGSKQPPLAPLSTAGKAAARATTQLLAHRKRPALDLPGVHAWGLQLQATVCNSGLIGCNFVAVGFNRKAMGCNRATGCKSARQPTAHLCVVADTLRTLICVFHAQALATVLVVMQLCCPLLTAAHSSRTAGMASGINILS